MDSLKILVTTVGGLTSPDIIRAYQENGERDIEVFGVDAFENAVGRYFCDGFETVPDSRQSPDQFVAAINHLVRLLDIDAIVPCGNEDNLALAAAIDELESPALVARYADLALAYDKGHVYRHLQEHLPEISPVFRIVNNFDAFNAAVASLDYPNRPLVIKPRTGRGGRGVFTLDGNMEFSDTFGNKPGNRYPMEFFTSLLSSRDRFEDLIVMEYLDQPNFSLYSLCDDDETRITLTHTRDWGNASQTFRGRVYHDPAMQSIAERVNRMFNCRYTTNMELATDDSGRIKLFDLNPRIGASSGIDREIGLNFPYLSLKLLLGEPVTVDANSHAQPLCFIRYFDNVWSHG